MSRAAPLISVVVPAFNEQDNVRELAARVSDVLRPLGLSCELLFVDDGSRDDTAARVLELAGGGRGEGQPEIRLLRLSRNFGHQAALLAGLDQARGAAVITMDADLQHPPELLPELIARWRAGAEVVQTIRREPADNDPLKRAASRGFYRVLSAVARIRVTPGAADFRLLSREAVDAFRACRERVRFNRGLVQWIGFPYEEVPYDAAARHAGRSKYSWRAMLRLAGDAVFSFSTWPLRAAGLLGVAVSASAALYLLYVVWMRLFTSSYEPGWGSILGTLLVIGGVQLIFLSVLGEYIGRLYEEVKHRPLYILRQASAEARAARSSAPLSIAPERPAP